MELLKVQCDECGDEFFVSPDTGEVYTDENGEERIGYETFLSEDDYGDAGFFDLKGEGAFVCPYCVEMAGYEFDTVVVVGPEGKEILRWDGRIAYFGNDVQSEDYREIAKAIARGTEWVSTSAWRGYTKAPDAVYKMVRALSGWHSSMEGSELSDKINALTREEIDLGYPIAIVFSRTSNVCAIGLDVYAPEDKVDEVQALLDAAPAPGYAGF